MGKGIALSIKEMYPNAYQAYKTQERRDGLRLGHVSYSEEPNNLIVMNGITQKDYWIPSAPRDKRYVDYGAIALVFEQVAKWANYYNVPVHFPAVGSGLGGGDWSIIEPIIHEQLKGIEHYLWRLK